MTERRCDVAVLGGGLGGVAGALAAAEAGADVLLVAQGPWVGGQLTAQGVCTPDENAWIEAGGCTRSYQRLRAACRAHYAQRYRLTEAARGQRHLNIGECWVSRMAVEPRVAEAILTEQLRHAGVRVLRGASLAAVVRSNEPITHVTLADGSTVRAAVYLDATETGEALHLAGIPYRLGAEGRAETGEPSAPEEPQREWIQPFTFPFALELRPAGEVHTIPRPPHYEQHRATQRYHVVDGAMTGMFGDYGWWRYRRTISAACFDDPTFPCDVAMVNTGSNDYLGGIYPVSNPRADQQTLQSGRLASLGYVYWLQTECPREDRPGEFGYPELRLRSDWFGTRDGLCVEPYIRESRRLCALKSVTEADIVTTRTPGPRAVHQADSCGIGHYWLDVHAGASPEPGRFMETHPYQVPAGALVGRHCPNLIAAAKNLGVTHLTNGAFRLHPVEWAIGEAAGTLAALSLQVGALPTAMVAEGSASLLRLQAALVARGAPIYWWGDVATDSALFEPAQRLAMRGDWPGGDAIDLRPDAPWTAEAAEGLSACGRQVLPKAALGLTRGEVLLAIAEALT